MPAPVLTITSLLASFPVLKQLAEESHLERGGLLWLTV